MEIDKSTKEKIKDIREKVERGKEKGIKLERKKSPATIEKMRASATERWKREKIGKLPINFLSLDEALKLSLEEEALFCCQRYHLDQGMKFEIIAIGWHGEWIMKYLERGLKEAFKRAKQMLEWKQSQYVGIRTGEDHKDISAIGKVEWQGKIAWKKEIKYTVGLYAEHTGGLVKEKAEDDSGRDISQIR